MRAQKLEGVFELGKRSLPPDETTMENPRLGFAGANVVPGAFGFGEVEIAPKKHGRAFSASDHASVPSKKTTVAGAPGYSVPHGQRPFPKTMCLSQCSRLQSPATNQ